MGKILKKIIKFPNHPYILKKLSKSPPILTNLSVAVLVVFTGGSGVEIAGNVWDNMEKDEYVEAKIDMDDVCKSLEGEVIAKLNPHEKLVSSYPEISSVSDLWPVFRWKCVFKIEEPTAPGQLKEYTFKTKGLDLARYCQDKYNKNIEGFFKDYKEPDSFYCTRVHSKQQ
ncbi:MAG: hypothetical protein F6K21_24940 [Symploca sp. SIO2D2]|nr:hypothetical protein [Symploca sp. SIO2D2]